MQRKIVLASQSLRRKQLLKQIGIDDFEIRESSYEEDMTLDKTPVELAKFLAYKKAEEVATHYDDAVIIAGDTFIIFNNEIIGKAKDKKDAFRTLQKFSGQSVEVISGLAIWDTKTGMIINTYNTGWVKFRELSKKEIRDYLNSEKDVLGFAGSFGFLNKGAVLIESVAGDFYSVIGLPLTKVYLGLKKFGVDIFES